MNPTMAYLFAFMISALAATANLYTYLTSGSSFSLVCAVFCGLLCVWNLTMAARD